MAEGIKLYKHFADQIVRMGKIKRAWFTTFNLDISFFEKYMLSALMGVPYQNLKSAKDYEGLNANLANEQESLGEDKMEVKVFYDYRVLKTHGKPKQTSVHLHPVDIKLIKGLNPDLKFEEGVFHPKVILIETYSGECWLMVSSANLTFGGWSRNRECFFCEKIPDTQVGRDVGAFFSGITGSIKGFGENALLDKLNNGRFKENKENKDKWYFFSSFSKNKFIDQLNNTDNKFPLRVWSPYFADELPKLVDEIQEEYFDTIEIIPAKNENQKIRITEETYSDCLRNKEILFKQDKLPGSAQEAFVHAKVWLTPVSMAIGSWNMTYSGMNQSRKNNNNVEAGIIYDLSPREYESVLNDSQLSNLKSPEHFKDDELNKEKEDILDKFTLSVDIVIDWDKMELSLQNPGYKGLMKKLDENDFIILPGFGKLRIKELEYKLNFIDYKRTFLTDRFFQIEKKNGAIQYKGYIREIGLVSRPGNRFGNIDDFMKGWVKERPEDKDELHEPPDFGDNEDGTGEGDNKGEKKKGNRNWNDQNAWFSSFLAFESIINRIDKSNDKSIFPTKKEKDAELKKIGRVLPGSLSELKVHLELLVESFKNEREDFAKSPIYLWFLIEKANYVFNYFNNEIKLEKECIKLIKNLKFNELFNDKEIDEIGIENLEKWKKYIKDKMKEK